MVERNLLDDHPAHREADNVGRIDFEEIEQTGGIVRHVDHGIGHSLHRLFGEEGANDGRLVGWLPSPLRRQTTIAVVEADDLESPVNEQANELVSPVSQLAPKAHDEEQWFTIALDVVFDSDPVDVGPRHR